MENEYIVGILGIEQITHDVKRFIFEKPAGYKFVAGQATDVSIDDPKWINEKHPFTFTGLNSDKHLQFTIKIYNDHHGLTEALGLVKVGDALVIRDVWGAIEYKGKGVFIAGGAGVTPFIAILRQLHHDRQLDGNVLLFSNKTEADIILRDEFSKMLGKNFINTLTDEKNDAYDHGMIDKKYLQEKIKNFKQPFYICGPPAFVTHISDALSELGADPQSVVFEK
jgi:ferredoxin-NADP reductase